MKLDKIENIWTRDNNYKVRNDHTYVKNLYIKTPIFTIGFKIKDNRYSFKILSIINEKNRKFPSTLGAIRALISNLNYKGYKSELNLELIATRVKDRFDLNELEILLSPKIYKTIGIGLSYEEENSKYFFNTPNKGYHYFNLAPIVKLSKKGEEIFGQQLKAANVCVEIKFNRKFLKGMISSN